MTAVKVDLFTVDKMAGIEVERNKYPNDLAMLDSLRNGMTTLYNQCRPREFDLIKKLGNGPSMILRHPELIPNEFHSLLPCYFHWFSVSLCNYARLAGYIVGAEKGVYTQEDKKNNPAAIKQYCDAYVKGVAEIQDAYKWRNKVSAHFALTDPKGDNYVTMNVSALNMTGFINDRFVSKAVNVNVTHAPTGEEFTDGLPTWSLTQLFETLTVRYWPHVSIPVLPTTT